MNAAKRSLEVKATQKNKANCDRNEEWRHDLLPQKAIQSKTA